MWLLLGSLVLIQFGYPITESGGAWTGVYLLLYGGLVAFALRTTYAAPRRHWPLPACAALFVGGAAWFVADQDSAAALVAMLLGNGVLQVALLVLLLKGLVDSPPGTNGVDMLMIAVCGFLLLGGVFGIGAALMEIASPGSFSDPTVAIPPVPWQSLLYGSLVTLSALGFGDVTPVSSWARSACSSSPW